MLDQMGSLVGQLQLSTLSIVLVTCYVLFNNARYKFDILPYCDS